MNFSPCVTDCTLTRPHMKAAIRVVKELQRQWREWIYAEWDGCTPVPEWWEM